MKGKFDLPEKCSDVTNPAKAVVKDEVVVYHCCEQEHRKIPCEIILFICTLGPADGA